MTKIRYEITRRINGTTIQTYGENPSFLPSSVDFNIHIEALPIGTSEIDAIKKLLKELENETLD